MKKDYKGRKYKVLSYNRDYPRLFEEETKTLKLILGGDVDIEHIGSTSVPGLVGKPTIDILVIVKNISNVTAAVSKMETAGYKDLGEYVFQGARLFIREVNNARLVNVHFFPGKHPHIREMLLVRDYLRSHPDEVAQYGKLKQELAEKYPDDYGAYRKIKDDYMEELLKRAKSSSL